jgi:hypothetical protein
LRCASRSSRRLRLDPIEITVDVNLEERGRVVGGATCLGRNNALEAKAPEVKFIDENIDHAHRILLRHVVVQTLREQCSLRALLTYHKTLHLILELM